jgi:hypothetical protein
METDADRTERGRRFWQTRLDEWLRELDRCTDETRRAELAMKIEHAEKHLAALWNTKKEQTT